MSEFSEAEAAVVERFERTPAALESWSGGAADELREAVADALLSSYRSVYGETRGWNLTGRFTDAVLALPEVAELRAKAAGYDRVRELHERDDTEPYACNYCGQAWPCDTSRALDGTA